MKELTGRRIIPMQCMLPLLMYRDILLLLMHRDILLLLMHRDILLLLMHRDILLLLMHRDMLPMPRSQGSMQMETALTRTQDSARGFRLQVHAIGFLRVPYV
jgi:hypothetical protein